MSGWAQRVGGEYVAPKGVIGIVVAQKFPDPEAIRKTLLDGIERVAPDTVWVMRDAPRANHASTFAWRTFESAGIEPFLAPLTPAWDTTKPSEKLLARLHEKYPDQPWVEIAFREYAKQVGHDQRAHWRDVEMRGTCERIIVFHDKSSNITAEWLDYRDNGQSIAKIYVVERGKVKVKKYKKGRPVA